MKKHRGKLIAFLLIVLCIILTEISSFAHSGRTDSSGGHKDNKNKSGLGSYHYHCGGHPAHLHKNGVCPYASKTSSKTSSSKSSSAKSNKSSTSSSKKTTTTPKTVVATSIKINEKIEDLEVGKSKALTATITPSNTTNKTITWKSSNTYIATISSDGEITAKKSGTVNITATTSNGKSSTIKLNIKEDPKKSENSVVVKTSSSLNNVSNKTNMNENVTAYSNETDNPTGGLIALGLVGGGCYWVYKRNKRN